MIPSFSREMFSVNSWGNCGEVLQGSLAHECYGEYDGTHFILST